MRNVVITILFGVFLAILLVPGIALAEVCSTEEGDNDCDAKVAENCECGDVQAKKGDYCNSAKSTVYATKANCESGTGELPPANFRFGTESEVPSGGGALLSRIQLIANWVFAIFLAISLIYIVIGAFQFVTAGAEPAKIAEARQKITYAAIGIAIGLMVVGIPMIIRTIVT